MDHLIEDIIALEWEEVQKVNNEGGRAPCQDNFSMFKDFRNANYLAWSQEMLESYHQDLTQAISVGRNLLTEKYARMMESTAPEEYREFAHLLPPITKEKKELIENISQIVVRWTEEFAQEYPLLSGNGRPIHSYEDGPYTTSSETYLRGELSTYSEKTLGMYNAHVMQLLSEGKSLTRMIMENTVRGYGYDSFEQAEERIRGK